MKGAKDLSCDCGGFLQPIYVREELGKVKKLLACDCGMARKITIDGSVYKEETLKDGVVINTVKADDYDKKVFRYPPRGKYRVASHR